VARLALIENLLTPFFIARRLGRGRHHQSHTNAPDQSPFQNHKCPPNALPDTYSTGSESQLKKLL
jgi:hypothetical protein